MVWANVHKLLPINLCMSDLVAKGFIFYIFLAANRHNIFSTTCITSE